MSQLDDAVERIRAAAGAEFGFVLSRQGQLVTKNAPAGMPMIGRSAIVQAAGPIIGKPSIIELRMPRSSLVPFGGSSAISVFIGVVAERAIVCLVAKAPAPKRPVRLALEEGLRAIEPILHRALARPGKGRAVAPEWLSTKQATSRLSAPTGNQNNSVSPSIPHIASDPKPGTGPTERLKPSSGLRDTSPEVVVERARRIGTETLAAIEASIAADGPPPTKPPIPPEALRKTLPWIDTALVPQPHPSPSEVRRRQSSNPEVTVKIEEIEMSQDMFEPTSPPPSSRRRGGKGTAKGARRR